VGTTAPRLRRSALNEDELGELTALAKVRGLPVSTVARQRLLQALAQGDDLKAAVDRL